ncbi:MAG: hypothetical protein L6Q84_14725 [Polyangiaceae bacterium]|nr:hypothetical protein [Polyangiaceae bacterium]
MCRSSRVAGACLALLLSGCGGPTFIVQQYPGPVRPSDSIAVLRVNGDGGIVLVSLDGEPIRTRVADDARLHVEMLPGRHRLSFADLADASRPLGRAAFVAGAGKTYRPLFASRGGGARVFEVDAASDEPLQDATVEGPGQEPALPDPGQEPARQPLPAVR